MAASRRSGFEGERIRVLSRKIAARALASPVTSQLLVTDCGYFPRAAEHRRSRPHGAGQAIIIVCTEGRGWCELGGHRLQLGPGESLVIPTGAPHVYGCDPGAPWTVWWLHVTGRDADALVAATGDRPVLRVSRLAAAVELIDEAITALETDDSPGSLLTASGAAWHL
ncbi:MAG: AraC family ligand binding domain-containing protein, partial [Ornithinimicrobium sp.]